MWFRREFVAQNIDMVIEFHDEIAIIDSTPDKLR